MPRPLSRGSAAISLLMVFLLAATVFAGASTPPEINIDATTLPTMGEVGQSFHISVPVSDDTGVDVVKIVYKPVGASAFEEINMTLSGGDLKSGTWVGTIPAQSSSGVLEFHIYARDNEGLSSMYPVNDEQEIFIGTSGTAPKVLYFVPEDGAVVDPGTTDSIKIVFNTAMDRTSVEEAVSIFPPVDTGRFIWSDNGTEVTIPLSAPLSPGTNYTITLSSSARSADGTPISSTQTVKFYAIEDFSGSAGGWDPVMVSIASIGVLLLIAVLLMRGLIKRNSGGKKDE